MKPFSLLIKPASADCNLRCVYCFYLAKSALYPETSKHRMSDDVLKAMVSRYMATDQPQYTFGWQGGEPTLMGVDFFKRVTELQQKHGRRGAVVANGLQTNATLIDDEFAAHLGRYRFLLGVSLDGPAEIHDHYRKRASGAGSHAEVISGIECLKRHGVEFNILTLVNDVNVGRGREVYRYLRDLGFHYHQYIPCVEFDDAGRILPFSVSGEAWGDFLCEVFDEWVESDTRIVSVRLFDSVLNYLVTGAYNVCYMQADCRQYFLVEHNGDVYPCDFFVEPQLKLGNVKTDDWEDLHESPRYVEFGARKKRWNNLCNDCLWRRLCAGDCPKHRIRGDGDPSKLSFLCEGWKRFYEHAMPTLEGLADEIRRERARASVPPSRVIVPGSSGKPGRNDPCPCGSGRKFKHCCGRNA